MAKDVSNLNTYTDNDDDTVWEFEGKVKSDDTLLTPPQDFAGAINWLFQNGTGGGDDVTWQRPSDWPVLPQPEPNQIVYLNYCNNSSSPSTGLIGSTYDDNGKRVGYKLPSDMTVDWGDGNVETYNAGEEINFFNYYYSEDGDNRYWHEGGAILNDGAHVYTVVATIPSNVVIDISRNNGVLEVLVGANVRLLNQRFSPTYYELQHIKFYGWNKFPNKTAVNCNIYSIKLIELSKECTYLDDDFASLCYSLLKITGLENVVEIGNYCFRSAYSLQKIDMPSLVKCGNDCFNYCDNLYSLNMPLLSEIGETCFQLCYNLREIKLPSLETTGNSCFQSCYSVYNVELDSLQSTGESCLKDIRRLKIFNAPALTKITKGSMSGLRLLETLSIPNVTSVGYNALNDCVSLRNVEISDAAVIDSNAFRSSTLWMDNPNTIHPQYLE